VTEQRSCGWPTGCQAPAVYLFLYKTELRWDSSGPHRELIISGCCAGHAPEVRAMPLLQSIEDYTEAALERLIAEVDALPEVTSE
jgi:hypothetical protein